MGALRSLLEEIKAGTTTFRSSSEQEPDMLDFQVIAKLLDYANSEGLLVDFSVHRESKSGNRWYDLAHVKGGLSHKGEMYLARPSEEVEKKAECIILLKPNIHGIGLDLIALLRRWKSRRK